MSVEFETKVLNVIPRTYNVRTFRFSSPKNFSYKPGQFFFLTIKPGPAEEMTKHFSFSSSPTETEKYGFIEFTKKLTGSDFSNALEKLRPGDWTRIADPQGTFTFEGEKNIAMLSGGIGITALRSMLKFITDKKLDTDVVLLYSNRTEKDIVFKDELEEWSGTGNIKVVNTLTEPATGSWKGLTGRIDSEMIKQDIPDYMKRTFFSCGPPKMVEAMVVILKELGVPDKKIKTENFTGY